MMAPTFIEKLMHANTVASQHSEGVEEQPQSGSIGLGAQMAFVDDYPQKTSTLLERETPEGGKDIPQIGTSAMIAITQ